MFSLNMRHPGRLGAGGLVAALVATLLVSVTPSVAVAADASGYLVESGEYPDAAAVGADKGIVLKDGNGGLKVAECVPQTGQIEVEREWNDKFAKVCFETIFRPAVLNLEIESSFGVKAGEQPVEVTYTVDGGPEEEAVAPPLRRATVDLLNEGDSTIVVLEVQTDPEVDVPATADTHPRTAIAKVRTGLGSCTGTLIDPSWVLTAASCFTADVATLAAGAPTDPARVLFGPDAANDRVASGAGELGVKVTQIEPAGDGTDAVLVKLETPVDDIAPLPVAATEPVAGQEVAFTGFGRTPDVWVPLASRTNTYPVTEVTPTTLTAAASTASLCVGDGGAPGVRNIDGTETLVAVASQANQAGCWGSGVVAGSASVVATRGDALAGWIAAILQSARNTTPVTAEEQALAQQIIESGRVSGAEPLAQLQAYANGVKRGLLVDGQIRDCTIDPVILKALQKVVVDDGFEITISSLNESCTTATPDEASYHAKGGSGSAVDISVVNGVASTGATAEDLALTSAMFGALPAPAAVGQLTCRAELTVPNGWAQTEESCDHNHFEYHGKPLTPAKPSFDLNSDGKADIFGITTGNALNIYQGNGNGGWATYGTVSRGWDDAKALIHGDYNGDGNGDMMVVNNDGTLWFYEGDGALNFPKKSLVARGWDTKSLITGGVDFNGDKRADLVARDTDGHLYSYPGNGNGTFGSAIKIGNNWMGISKVLAGDFTGDGKGDIVATSTDGELRIYPGDGSKLLGRVKVGAKWNTIYVLAGGVDYGRDGKADLFGRTSDGGLYVYPGLGIKGFAKNTRVGNGWTSLRLFS